MVPSLIVGGVGAGLTVPRAALLGLAAATVCVLLTPLARRLGRRWRLVDLPGPGRSHSLAVPRSGGLAVIATGLLLWPLAPAGPALLAGGALAGLTGVLDDVHPLRPVAKLGGQTLAAAAFALLAPVPSPPIAILWIVGMTNATNIIDGLDGLAGGCSVVSAAAIGLAAALSGQASLAAAAAVLAGAAAGFTVHNLRPGYCFMGDGGSHFLGFGLGALALQVWAVRPGPVSGVALAALLSIPLFDLLTSVLRRTLAGGDPMRRDLGHFYHRLAGRWGAGRTVATCWSVQIVGAAGGLALWEGGRAVTAAALLAIALAVVALAGRRLGFGRHGPGRRRTAGSP